MVRFLSCRLLLCSVVAMTAGAGLTVAATTASAFATCDTSWANPGTSGTWSTPSNWTNGVPTASTVACLGDVQAGYEVFVNGSANEAKGLIIESTATLAMQGEADDLDAALSVGTGGISNAGGINMTSLNGSHQVTLTVAAGAKLINSGILEADPGAGGNRFLHGAVVNTGT